MAESQISRESILFISEQIPVFFTYTILQRGYDYFVGKLVKIIDEHQESQVVASVDGTHTYHVLLDVDFFQNSHCSCPFDGYCKHMAAVFFTLYARFERPKAYLLEQKAQMNGPRKRKAAKVVTNRATAAASRPPEPATLEATSTAAEWEAFFARQFHQLGLVEGYRLIEDYAPFIHTLQSASQDWSPLLRSLFEANGLLYYLGRLEIFLQEKLRPAHLSYSQYLTLNAAAETTKARLFQALKQIDPAEAIRHYPAYVQKISDSFTHFASPANEKYVDWPYLYQKLWVQLLTLPAWRAEEAKRLDSLLYNLDTPGSSHHHWLLFQRAHQHTLRKNDAKAQELFSQSGYAFSYLLFYFDHFSQEQDWERLLSWLRWSLPSLRDAEASAFRLACHFWEKATEHLPVGEEWIQAQKQLLPRSYPFYADFLLETNRPKSWVDLQLARGLSPLELDKDDLKRIEAQDIHLLLPLYHLAVERYIAEKNRDSYRLAVRMLKKLRIFYKKLQLPARWEQYLQHIVSQNNRLRALQEELKKGKLVT